MSALALKQSLLLQDFQGLLRLISLKEKVISFLLIFLIYFFNVSETRNHLANSFFIALPEFQPRDFFLRHLTEVSAMERVWLLKTWRLLQNDASNVSGYRPAGRENDNQSCQPGSDHGMKKDRQTRQFT